MFPPKFCPFHTAGLKRMHVFPTWLELLALIGSHYKKMNISLYLLNGLQ